MGLVSGSRLVVCVFVWGLVLGSGIWGLRSVAWGLGSLELGKGSRVSGPWGLGSGLGVLGYALLFGIWGWGLGSGG